MSFLPRFGISLLLFGIVTLIAHHFGYAPRKLANLPPEHIRTMGFVFVALGGIVLGCTGPRARKILGWTALGSLGVVVLITAIAVLVHKFGRRTSFPHPAPPPIASSPAIHPAPATPSANHSAQLPPTHPAAKPPLPGAQPPHEKPAFVVLQETKRDWETRFGRERVWNIVVHLSGKEPPADFESRLRTLVKDSDGGGVFVSRTGGLLEASLAPNDDAATIEAALKALFPEARVQRHPSTTRFVVFAR